MNKAVQFSSAFLKNGKHLHWVGERYTVDFFHMLANDRGFMLFYALVKMTCCVTDTIRIARITFEIVN